MVNSTSSPFHPHPLSLASLASYGCDCCQIGNEDENNLVRKLLSRRRVTSASIMRDTGCHCDFGRSKLMTRWSSTHLQLVDQVQA